MQGNMGAMGAAMANLFGKSLGLTKDSALTQTDGEELAQ